MSIELRKGRVTRAKHTHVQLHELCHNCDIRTISLVQNLPIMKDYVDDKRCDHCQDIFGYKLLGHNVVSYTDICESVNHKLRHLSNSQRRLQHSSSFLLAF